jgi:cytokinin riboside 5'-monophosphate phosphoribohydrolase
MNKVICVFSSSSNTIDQAYYNAASELGSAIASQDDVFLFGGGLTGLMGECARAVHRSGGKVIGVIPEALNEKGIVYESCDELIVTSNMRERKAQMDERSDAFIALPGGFGTIEEVMEIITLKQLRYHNKPIVLLNISGFYDHLLEHIKIIVDQQFAKTACYDLFFVTDNVKHALDYVESYAPEGFEERWLTAVEPSGTDDIKAYRQMADFEYCKIETFIPKTHLALIKDALRSVDAGHLGNYDSCLSYSDVTGCWRALPGSRPYEGTFNVDCSSEEYKVEAICLAANAKKTIRAIKDMHPYELPVINAIPLYKTGL